MGQRVETAPRLSVRTLASGLGLSKSQIWRNLQAGMPAHSIEAAREWRAHVRDRSSAGERQVERSLSSGRPDGTPAAVVPSSSADSCETTSRRPPSAPGMDAVRPAVGAATLSANPSAGDHGESLDVGSHAIIDAPPFLRAWASDVLSELRGLSALLREDLARRQSAPDTQRVASRAGEQVLLQIAAIFIGKDVTAADVVEATRQPHNAALRVNVDLAINGIDGGDPVKRLAKILRSMAASSLVVEELMLQENGDRRGSKLYRVVRVSRDSGSQTRTTDYGSSISYVDPSRWRASGNASDINDLGAES